MKDYRSEHTVNMLLFVTRMCMFASLALCLLMTGEPVQFVLEWQFNSS